MPRRRLALVLSWVLLAAACQGVTPVAPSASPPAQPPAELSRVGEQGVAEVGQLAVRGRGPKTGYSRRAFGPAWQDVDHNGCDTRNDILRRDLTLITFRAGTHECVVLSGRLDEPYTGRVVQFSKAQASLVQIDHVVALSDAWQKGAAGWPYAQRLAFANDPLNLLAVDGPANQAKGDADTASWLPPNKGFRCRYVSRQVAVKRKYGVHVTGAEREAMVRVLSRC